MVTGLVPNPFTNTASRFACKRGVDPEQVDVTHSNGIPSYNSTDLIVEEAQLLVCEDFRTSLLRLDCCRCTVYQDHVRINICMATIYARHGI